MYGGVLDVETRLDRCVGTATQFHQIDVILHEFDFFPDRNIFPIAFIQSIVEQIVQLGDAVLGRVGVYLNQAGNVVQRIEQEMGVQLVFQP